MSLEKLEEIGTSYKGFSLVRVRAPISNTGYMVMGITLVVGDLTSCLDIRRYSLGYVWGLP